MNANILLAGAVVVGLAGVVLSAMGGTFAEPYTGGGVVLLLMAIWFVLDELFERVGKKTDLQDHPKKTSKLLDIGSVDKRRKIMMTEEEMRQALFGSRGPAEQPTAPQIEPHAIVVAPSTTATKGKEAKPFTPKLKVTLRVGNEFEGKTELLTYEADTLSTLQAELDATKMARKKYRFIEVVSVNPAK